MGVRTSPWQSALESHDKSMEARLLDGSSLCEAGSEWPGTVELSVSSSPSDGDDTGIKVVSISWARGGAAKMTLGTNVTSAAVGGTARVAGVARRTLGANVTTVAVGGTAIMAGVAAGVFLLRVLAAMGESVVGAASWCSSSSEKFMMQGILGAGAKGRAVLQMGSLISAMTRLSCS